MKRQHPTDPNLFWCRKCQQYKNIGNFFGDNRKGNKYNVSYVCTSCNSKMKRGLFSQYYHKHHKQVLAGNNRRSKIYTETLKDCYIRQQLKARGITDPTKVVMDIFRIKLSMKRTLNQFKQWREEHESDHTDVYAKQRQDEGDHEGQLQA